MNRIYCLVWNHCQQAWVAAPETARARGKRALAAVATALVASSAVALPMGGAVSVGQGDISQSGATLSVNQQSQKLAVNWNSFSIGANETVNFQQPNSSAIALNRIVGSDPSQIYGHLNANGQVFLLNPNGVLFAPGSQVNVSGLVASTFWLADADFVADQFRFSGVTGNVVNQGNLTAAEGGYIALLGGQVSNQGTIVAKLGTVDLVAGSEVTLDFAGDGLLSVQVNQGAVDALAENKQLIRADGGQVLLTAKAADALASAVVNNSGVIEARTLSNRAGVIELLADAEVGQVNVGGTLDASAAGGNGGKIETSGQHVSVAPDAVVTTRAVSGKSGDWLLDSMDFMIAASGGDITGAQLGSNLARSNITIATEASSNAYQNSGGTNTVTPASGNGSNGDIHVNDTVSWGANTLTLNAYNNININAVMTASGTASLALNYGGTNGSTSATPTEGSGVNVELNTSGFTGQVNFTGTGNSISINGAPHTIITTLGGQGGTTGTDLQGINGNLAGHYVLGANIDASGTSGWNSGAGFTPIGNSTTAFTGVFDGLGHTISGLHINTPNVEKVGLFGVVSSGGAAGVIRQVGMVEGSVSGSSDVGGLVGYNGGGRISNSYSTGAVTGSSDVGGLMGLNYGSYGGISNSFSTGAVTGTATVGGLVGRNYGSSDSINSSFSTGAVTGTTNVGGLVGVNDGNFGSISNSFSTGAVTGTTNVGGLVGLSVGSDSISNSYYDIGSVSINGKTGVITLGGISDNQYQTWVAGKYAPLNPVSYFTQNSSGFYQLSTAQDLLNLLPFTEENFYATQFQLTANIDLTNQPGWFIPYFGAQQFDGNGFTISNLSVNQPYNDNIGFIGILGGGGSITNLGLRGGSVSGSSHVGGLVGDNYGSISNSYSTGAVTGTTDIGGLVGQNYGGSISNSYSTGAVTGTTDIGGLAGFNNGVISNSYSTGAATGTATVGGLVGQNYGSISNSYNTGAVTGTATVGGLVGINYEHSNIITISNSFNTGAVTGTTNVGGLVGFNDGNFGNSIRNSYYDIGSVSINGTNGVITLGGISDNQYQTWVAGKYASLNPASYFTQNSSGFYQLSTAQDLLNLLPFTEDNFPTTRFQLTANIDLTNQPGWFIPYFGAKQFDGNGFTISNLSVNQPYNDNIGFIGILVGGGNISNLGLRGGSVSGSSNVGELVGYNGYGSSVSNSYSTGTVTGATTVGGLAGFNYGGISNSYSTGTVTGTTGVGGLAGVNFYSISNSYSTGVVTGSTSVGGLVGDNGGGVSNSYSTGAVTGTTYVGGLVGFVDFGSISNSYSTGAVTGSTYAGGLVGLNIVGDISNSYSTGAVTGSTDIGGLVGLNDGGSISNSYWATDLSGQTTSTEGTGLTSTQMLQSSNFVGWDIDTVGGGSNVWRQYNGHTTPLLAAFLTPVSVMVSNASVSYDASNQAGAAISLATSSPNMSAVLGIGNAVNVGTYTVNGSQLYSTQQGYDLSFSGNSSATLTITPKILAVTGEVADNKTYDDTTTANLHGGSLVGVVSGDSVSLTQAGSFTSANAGNGISVTAANTLSGSSASNYTLTQPTGLTANITPAMLAVTVTGTKIFDGTEILSNPVFSVNPIGDDQVTATGQATFSDAFGLNIPITATGVTLAGAAAKNYIVGTVSGTGKITAAPLAGAPVMADASTPTAPVILSVPDSVLRPPPRIAFLAEAADAYPDMNALVMIEDGGVRLP
jgi:filamentous hemagglutinin family protein